MNLKTRIIELLGGGEKTIRELSRELRVSESVVRKELSDLMRMGVVASRKVLNERHRYIGIYRLVEGAEGAEGAEETTSLSEEEKRIFRRVEPALAGRTSIIVLCPKCGKEGKLRKGSERGKTVFYVVHGSGPRQRQHRIGMCHPSYETLLGIYRKVRARPYLFVKTRAANVNASTGTSTNLVWCWKGQTYIYDWQCRRWKWVCDHYVINGGECFGC